jgi:hypothetical protein
LHLSLTHIYIPSAVPCKQYQFSKFMPDISRNAGCSPRYTAHCLRSTAIQALNDRGFELRHIMFMSGHQNEASVRSYNRECSNEQKHRLSTTIAGVARPQPPATAVSSESSQLQFAFPPMSSASTNPFATTPLTPAVNVSSTATHNTANSQLSSSFFHKCIFC